MKKYTLLLLIVTLVFAANDLSAQTKVGYINPQAVLGALPETEAVQKKLTEFAQLKQSEFAIEEEAFLAKVRQVQEQVQANLITEADLENERIQLEQQQEELVALQDSHQIELRRRQQELLQPILASIDTAIGEVAVELGLDYVLNELTNQGEMILLFVSNDGKNSLNITDRVIQKLK
jgi:outer membrane protein